MSKIKTPAEIIDLIQTDLEPKLESAREYFNKKLEEVDWSLGATNIDVENLGGTRVIDRIKTELEEKGWRVEPWVDSKNTQILKVIIPDAFRNNPET